VIGLSAVTTFALLTYFDRPWSIYLVFTLKPTFHTYIYARNNRENGGFRYDVGVENKDILNAAIDFIPFGFVDGYISKEYTKDADVDGFLRIPVGKLSDNLFKLWEVSTYGISEVFEGSAAARRFRYNIPFANCTTFSIYAAGFASALSAVPFQ